jgi:hypothetical protein
MRISTWIWIHVGVATLFGAIAWVLSLMPLFWFLLIAWLVIELTVLTSCVGPPR